DVLEVECSRLSSVVRRRMNLSNKLWEPLRKKSLDQVLVMEASLRLGEYDEAYWERLEIV
ncbi:hypothetical protein A2U01_0087919, partial [Trifolium medium]|nr:hypothetical protein [Trifolium medium]